MDVQERMIEQDFGFTVMNFSCSEILKFISKVNLLIKASLFSDCCLRFCWPQLSFLQMDERLELLEHFENFREVENF